MSDATTTVSELRQIIREFVDERDWRQFHAPKNVSMALADFRKTPRSWRRLARNLQT